MERLYPKPVQKTIEILKRIPNPHHITWTIKSNVEKLTSEYEFSFMIGEIPLPKIVIYLQKGEWVGEIINDNDHSIFSDDEDDDEDEDASYKHPITKKNVIDEFMIVEMIMANGPFDESSVNTAKCAYFRKKNENYSEIMRRRQIYEATMAIASYDTTSSMPTPDGPKISQAQRTAREYSAIIMAIIKSENKRSEIEQLPKGEKPGFTTSHMQTEIEKVLLRLISESTTDESNEEMEMIQSALLAVGLEIKPVNKSEDADS